MNEQFSYQNPRDRENEINASVTSDGKLCISVADEKAVDSYNSTFECDIVLPADQTANLRDWLNKHFPGDDGKGVVPK